MVQRHDDILLLDGSRGDGGGQVLRAALGLSLASGRAFRIEKIRAGRQKPGLLRHHLVAVRAAAALCEARVEGAAVGSQALSFAPRALKPGEYHFALGTGGSATLLFLTILPGLLRGGGRFSLTFDGPTHCPAAPPLEFVERALLPLLQRMGAGVHVALERPGFSTAGGGRFFANVEPGGALAPLRLEERGRAVRSLAKAVVAALPGEIAVRELESIRDALNWPAENTQIRQLREEHGPGNAITVELAFEHVTEVISACGMRGLPAEEVAAQAVRQVREYLAADAPVGPHLAEHLLVPLAMAGGGRFRTAAMTRAAEATASMVKDFLGVGVTVHQNGHADWSVTVGGG